MPVALERVTHIYHPGSPWSQTALQDVSLRLAPGEIVGLIGPTGSGKSTLIQHCNGLLRPTSGRVWIDGQDLWGHSVDRRKLRLQVGLVFQYPEHQLFEETVEADLAFGPKNLGLEPSEIRRRVRRSLVRVGLPEEVLARSPFQLSGGQMRRLAIAGVLAMEPKVLILDEPTAGLDPQGREQILTLIRELHRAEHLTILFVSHNMEEIAAVAQRVVVLHEGRILMNGPVREVYSRAHRLQDIGLDVPAPTRVVSELAGQGWPIRTDVLTVEEGVEAVAAILSGASGCARGASPS